MQENFLTLNNYFGKPHARIYNLMLFKYFSKRPHRGGTGGDRENVTTPVTVVVSVSVTMLQV
jgi:hypothetical protein